MKRFILFLSLLLLISALFTIRTKKPKDIPPSIIPLIPPKIEVLTGRIGSAGSLYNFLQNKGLSKEEIVLLKKAITPLFNPKRYQAMDRYELIKKDNKFQILKYYINPIEFYIVKRAESGKFIAAKGKVQVERKLVGLAGKIKRNLYDTMRRKGYSPSLIMNFVEIFASKIDFLTDVRPKDTFKLIWEVYKKDGKKVTDGRILAAQYNRYNGSSHTAIFFKDPSGHADYYTVDGKSLRSRFLSAPLNYKRITSYFTYRRFHPVLKIYRPHLGIDYAAPVGTPVVSVGDGEVVYKGWNGGYGKFIKIRHDHSFYTTYGHLSRYAKGIERGKRVRQGQVIGYVGSTGLSTGPHLDFRAIKNGRFVDFLKLNISSARSVDSRYMDEFLKIKKKRIAQLNSLGD